jgi:hypothetical protein
MMSITFCLLRRARSLLSIVGLAAAFSFPVEAEATAENDTLISVESYFAQTDPAYRHLWERKLIASSGDIARVVFLPELSGTEAAITIYKDDIGKHSYRVIKTRPSVFLWESMVSDRKKAADVKVERATIRIPSSTALVVYRALHTMLLRARNISESGKIPFRTIFFVREANGKIIRAQLPNGRLGPNTSALAEIVTILSRCCEEPSNKRAGDLRRLEKVSADLAEQKRGGKGNEKVSVCASRSFGFDGRIAKRLK